jgi:hypothetical protein
MGVGSWCSNIQQLIESEQDSFQVFLHGWQGNDWPADLICEIRINKTQADS